MKALALGFILTIVSLPALSQIDQELKEQLDAIFYKDQQCRQLIMGYDNLSERQKDSLCELYHTEREFLVGTLWARQDSLDKANQEAVTKMIEKYGYPGKSLVGEPTNEAAFYVIQHSIPLIEKYHGLVKQAAANGEIPAHLWPMMERRLETKRDITRYQVDTGYNDVSDNVLEEITAINTYEWPEAETASSSYRYYRLADSFSRVGDTTNAEKYFLLTDPYHLLSLQVAYGGNNFISHLAIRDSVTANVKNMLAGLSRSSMFDTFATFFVHVRDYKNVYGNKTDIRYEDSVRKLDSVQQEYLRHYLMKYNEWPSLKDGAIFAAFIASRDINSYYTYIPLAKDGYYANKVSALHIERILDNKRFFALYNEVSKKIRHKYIRHDLTWCVGNAIPYTSSAELTGKIAEDARGGCPVKDIFIVHYVSNTRENRKNDHCDSKVAKESHFDLLKLVAENCLVFRNITRGKAVSIYHLPNLMYNEEKLFFYLTY